MNGESGVPRSNTTANTVEKHRGRSPATPVHTHTAQPSPATRPHQLWELSPTHQERTSGTPVLLCRNELLPPQIRLAPWEAGKVGAEWEPLSGQNSWLTALLEPAQCRWGFRWMGHTHTGSVQLTLSHAHTQSCSPGHAHSLSGMLTCTLTVHSHSVTQYSC